LAIVFAENEVKVGTPVTLFSQMGQFLGTKPIAKAVVIAACKNEPKAPITPTGTGKPRRNAWRNLYRIKVTEILE
jgi:hypothetical protein